MSRSLASSCALLLLLMALATPSLAGCPADIDVTAFITKHEGSRSHVYYDTTGHATIGVGFNLDRGGARALLEGMGINYDDVRAGRRDLSHAEINAILNSDLNGWVSSCAASSISNYWSQPQPVRAVVMDMVFNLGCGGWNSFDEVRSYIAQRQYSAAANLIRGYLYCRQVGRRCTENTGILDACNGGNPPPPPPPAGVDVYYRVRTAQRGWLPEVKNLNDYAGIPGQQITDVAIGVSSGSVRYQVHNRGGSWLPNVTGYNINDDNNGYAGNHNIIDAITVVFTVNGKKAHYRVSPVNAGYFDWQNDNEKGSGQDGYAGSFGRSIDRFQIQIV